MEKRLPPRLRPGFGALYALMNLIGEAGDLAERRLLASSEALPTNLLVHAVAGDDEPVEGAAS